MMADFSPVTSLTELFSYPFMVRAFIVGTLSAMAAALVGVPLVLRRFSMIGDGLSHVAFGAIAVGMVFQAAPLAVALPVVAVAAFWLLKAADGRALSGDAAIAMLSSTALATGITAVSLTEGFNTDAESILFGSILGLTNTDVIISGVVAVAVIAGVVLLFPRLFSLVFDAAYTEATGLSVRRLSTILALMTALTVVTGMHIMGALLISSLIVFPPMSAMRLFDRYVPVCWAAALIALVALWSGLLASYYLALPAGAAIVLANALIYLLTRLLGDRR